MRLPRRVCVAALPTPLVKLERLGRALGGANIFIKRDDLTGLEISGNKVRKLEYILADAIDRGCDTIVTEGASQSNHCRATAAACARLGLRAVLLLRSATATPPQGNHLLDVLFGAETRGFTNEDYAANRERIIADTLRELEAAGRRPRFTPSGASEPLGCWGYVRATAELADQLHAAGVGECDVMLAVSSGATHAGAVLGTLLHRLDHWTLSAVPVSDDVAYHRENVARLCREAIAAFDIPIAFHDDRLRFVEGYVGDGYAVPYNAEIEAIRLLARTEGIILDPVYTGKTFCALLDGVRAGRLGFERPVAFVHTGGIFSDFAWADTLAASGRKVG
jgi:D-cysteine desulfhydrase